MAKAAAARAAFEFVPLVPNVPCQKVTCLAQLQLSAPATDTIDHGRGGGRGRATAGLVVYAGTSDGRVLAYAAATDARSGATVGRLLAERKVAAGSKAIAQMVVVAGIQSGSGHAGAGGVLAVRCHGHVATLDLRTLEPVQSAPMDQFGRGALPRFASLLVSRYPR